LRFLVLLPGGRPRRLGAGDSRLAGSRLLGNIRVAMDGSGGRDDWGGRGGGRVGGREAEDGEVFVDVFTDGGVHACAEVDLDKAGANAMEVAEGTAVAGVAPTRRVRLVGSLLHPLEDVGDETILCSAAIVCSAAALPALPGLCASMAASPDALLAVNVMGACGMALAASWAWATAAAAAAAVV
jgi:hypothetical protein